MDLPEGFHDLGEEIKKISLPSMDDDEGEEKYHYPCLYFSGKESLKNLPSSGTAVIHFKKVSETETESSRNGEKKKSYSVELEIHGIKPMDGQETSEVETEEPSDEDAIEKGLEAASENNDND